MWPGQMPDGFPEAVEVVKDGGSRKLASEKGSALGCQRAVLTSESLFLLLQLRCNGMGDTSAKQDHSSEGPLT